MMCDGKREHKLKTHQGKKKRTRCSENTEGMRGVEES